MERPLIIAQSNMTRRMLKGQQPFCHQRLLLITVCALSTLWRCWCRQRVHQLSVTARFLWLQRGRGTVCHHRPGPPPRYWHFGGRPSLIFPSVIWLMEVWRCLCWLTVKLSARDVQHYLCYLLSAPATVAWWWCHLNHF